VDELLFGAALELLCAATLDDEDDEDGVESVMAELELSGAATAAVEEEGTATAVDVDG